MKVFGNRRRLKKPPRGEESLEKKPKSWLSQEEDDLTPERDLWQDPHDTISHYYRWIWEYLAYLPLLGDARRESKILEIGCSHGRTSRGLLHNLRSPGGYWGFDIDQAQVAEATKRITSRSAGFQYIHADVFHRQFNPTGTIAAKDFTFPFENAFFDCVYAASVFTHLLPEETERYFHETRRVLKAGGKALFSFFVRDFYRGPGSTISPRYEFDHDHADDSEVGIKFPEYPDVVIAYRENRIREFAQSAGLVVRRIVPGLWSNSSGVAVNEQDLVVLAG